MKTLADLRPVDGSARAIRHALNAAADERAAAVSRIDQLRSERQAMLLTGTNKQIGAVEASIGQTELLLDQIDALTPIVEAELPAATGREWLQEVVALVGSAREAADLFDRWAKKEWSVHAGALLHGLRLEAEALSLRRNAIEALRPIVSAPQLEAAGGIPPGLFSDFPESVGSFGCCTVLPAFGDTPGWSRS